MIRRSVVHVVSSPEGIGGAERVVGWLAGGARARGWDVAVLNPFDRSPDSPMADLCRPAAYEALRTERAWELPAARGWLRGRLRSFRPALVHAHMFHATVLGATLSLGRDTKRLYTDHHGEALRQQKGSGAAMLDELARSRYQAGVAVSQAGVDHIMRRRRRAHEPVVCIPNGWQGTPLPRLPSVVPSIVSVANLRPEKGHETLLRAFQRVVVRVPSAQLVLVGDGSLRAQLEDQSRELGIASRVRFAGHVDDVWPLLASAHLFVLASYAELCGIAVLEAMAAGVPVIVSAVGGLPEVVEPGVTGVLVPPHDAESLADGIVSLLMSPDRAGQLAARAMATAARSGTEAMVSRYLDLYESLLVG